MTLDISLALIAASAPLTAIILIFVPRKNGKNGYLTKREYDLHRSDLGNKLVGIDGRLDALDTRMRDLTTEVNSRLE